MDEQFTAYGTSHQVVLGVLLAGAVVLVVRGRRTRGTRAAEREARVLAVVTFCVVVPLQFLVLLGSGFDVERELPLQLCDLAALLAPYALWTKRTWAVDLMYFWGITLTTQAALTPDLKSPFPELSFLLFWGMHLLVIWSAVYLTWGLGRTPTWHGYRRSVALTAGYVVVMLAYNAAAGANYGFLNRKPSQPSILDYLGPWPVYLVPEIVIVAVVWALLTWPCVRTGQQHRQAVGVT